MRLRLLTVVGTMALALAVPSAALAHHGRGHHHHHKGKAHHASFHVVNIGPSSATTTPPAPSAGTPSAPPTEENAGTVASYEKEVLALTLKDGSTVSGKVTADTHIRCISPTASTEPGDGEQGEDNGQGDDQERGDTSQSGEGWGDRKDDGGDGEDGSTSTTPEPPCDTSALVKGAVVRSAQLRIGPAGNEWECIVLVRP